MTPNSYFTHLIENKSIASNYRKYYRFLLQNCSNYYHEAPIRDIKKLSKQYKSKLKQCYNNSIRIALDNDDMEYVEGFYTFWFDNLNMPPIEHAWNVNMKDNLIYDTTSILLDYDVDCRWGMVIPKPILKEYILEKTYMSPLLFFYTKYI